MFPVSSNEEELSENIRFVSGRINQNYMNNLEYKHFRKTIIRGWVLREEERWRMALDENKNKKDWRAMLWKVMNITKGLLKNLRKRRNVFTAIWSQVLAAPKQPN